MSLPIAFHEAAAQELTEAAAFYEAECPGLGVSFLADVEGALQRLGEFPESGARHPGGLRRQVLLRFPYTLWYSLRPDQLRILAVAHEKRRPLYWQGRQ